MEYGLGELVPCVLKMLAGILVGKLPFLTQIPAGAIFTVVLELVRHKNGRLDVALNLLCGTRGVTLSKSWLGGRSLGTNSGVCSVLAWYWGLGVMLALFNIGAELTKFLASDLKKLANSEEGRVVLQDLASTRGVKAARRVATQAVVAFVLTATVRTDVRAGKERAVDVRAGQERDVARAPLFFDEPTTERESGLCVSA